MKILSKIIGVLLIGLAIVCFSVWRGISDSTASGEAVSVAVEVGASTEDVADLLESMGLLDRRFLFRIYGRLTGRSKSIQAGEFLLAPGLGVRSIYETLSRASRSEQSITMLEGWNVREFAESIEGQGLANADEVVLQASAAIWVDKYPFLKEVPAGLDLEGYLFPESYRIFEGSTAADIIDRLLRQFRSEVVVAREDQIAASEYSLFEIVTIASIIEREVRGSEDMKLVADIIRKRLQDGMPLQMDSTVNYVTGGNKPGVSLRDTAIDSPYNTYKYAGLPLGPISNPSIAAIDAVLNPTSNDYYFFLTTKEGEVKYGRTHAEHIENRNLFLR